MTARSRTRRPQKPQPAQPEQPPTNGGEPIPPGWTSIPASPEGWQVKKGGDLRFGQPLGGPNPRLLIFDIDTGRWRPIALDPGDWVIQGRTPAARLVDVAGRPLGH